MTQLIILGLHCIFICSLVTHALEMWQKRDRMHTGTASSVTARRVSPSHTFIPETASHPTPGAPFQPYTCILCPGAFGGSPALSVAAFGAVGRTVLPMELASEAPRMRLGFSTASHQSHLKATGGQKC